MNLASIARAAKMIRAAADEFHRLAGREIDAHGDDVPTHFFLRGVAATLHKTARTVEEWVEERKRPQ